jgi:WD40 repeat protein
MKQEPERRLDNRRPGRILLFAFVIVGSMVLSRSNIVPYAQAQGIQKPLSEDDVITLLKGAVMPKRVGELAKERGVAFLLTPETERKLRQAGASDSLVAALRKLASVLPDFVLERTLPAALETLTDGTVLRGTVNSVAFSPDGGTLAAGTDMISFWDVINGSKVRELWPKGTVLAVAFSPDGRLLASGGYYGTLLVWEVTTGIQVHTLEINSGPVSSVAFSPDGRYFVAGTGGIANVQFRDGQLISTAQTAGNIASWTLPNTKELALKSVAGHGDGVASIAISPDGRLLATGNIDHTTRIWPATNLEHDNERTLLGRASVGTVGAVVFSPDGRLLAAGDDRDHTVYLWDVAAGRPGYLLVPDKIGGVRSVSIAFSPDGHWLAATSWDVIEIWDVETGREVLTLRGHLDNVCSVAFSADGRWLASGSEDGTVKLWRRRP